MRTLVRWSDSSLSMTTPRPWKAEPSRCMKRSLLHLAGLGLEVAGIDRLKARLLHTEEFQAALLGDDFIRRFRPHVAVGMQAQFADASLLDAVHAGNERKPLGKADTVGFDIDHIAATQNLPAELGHRTHQRDLAAAEQGDAVAHALHPLEQMRGQQHRHALGLEVPDDAEKLRGGVRIEARGRLVEDGDLRAFHQNLGEAETLPHAAREGGDALVGKFAEPDPLDRVGDALLALGEAKADQARGVAQVIGSGEVIVKANRVRQITDAALDRERLARGIKTEHAHLAAGDFGQAEQHQDGRRLARAVGAEETENLPAPDSERDVVDGNRRAVAFGKARGLDDGILVHRRPNLATAPTMMRSATPMIPTPAMPHIVEVVTVTRNVLEADSPRAEARSVVT